MAIVACTSCGLALHFIVQLMGIDFQSEEVEEEHKEEVDA